MNQSRDTLWEIVNMNKNQHAADSVHSELDSPLSVSVVFSQFTFFEEDCQFQTRVRNFEIAFFEAK